MHFRANGLNTASKAWPGRIAVVSRLQCVNSRRDFSSVAGETQDIAILGGGISGLASAYYLTQELPKARITIYEASDRLGGWLSSRRVPVKDGTVLFEAGPRTLRPSSNGVLAARLVCSDAINAPGNNRLIACSFKS